MAFGYFLALSYGEFFLPGETDTYMMLSIGFTRTVSATKIFTSQT